MSDPTRPTPAAPSISGQFATPQADRRTVRQIADRPVRATAHWTELLGDELPPAFTVAGLYRLDILRAMREGIERAVAGDLSRTDWERDVRALLERAGLWRTRRPGDRRDSRFFDPARLRLIFDTNTAQAYAAGRWARLWERRDTHPYLMYLTKQDERVRITHRAWHGVTLPVEHPFWNTHFPPNGFRCRCAVLGVTAEEYARAGGEGGAAVAGVRLNINEPQIITTRAVNAVTGEILEIPAGISPGFDYNPGNPAARQRRLAALEAEKLATVDAATRAAHEAAARAEAEALAKLRREAEEAAEKVQEQIAETLEELAPPPAPPLPPLPASAPAAAGAQGSLSGALAVGAAAGEDAQQKAASAIKSAAAVSETIPYGTRWVRLLDNGDVEVLEETATPEGTRQVLRTIPAAELSEHPEIARLLAQWQRYNGGGAR